MATHSCSKNLKEVTKTIGKEKYKQQVCEKCGKVYRSELVVKSDK